MSTFTKMGQGPAVLASDEDVARDEVGFTHPNLHRRIYTPPEGTSDRVHSLGIYGLNSYRMTEYKLHDEESTDSEIP